jgi:hypothetical protein
MPEGDTLPPLLHEKQDRILLDACPNCRVVPGHCNRQCNVIYSTGVLLGIRWGALCSISRYVE